MVLQARHEDGISSDVADIEDAMLLPQLGPIIKGGCRREDYWGPNSYKLVDQIGGLDLEANKLVPIAAHYRLLIYPYMLRFACTTDIFPMESSGYGQVKPQSCFRKTANLS